jgi:hypothetical protein
VDGPGQPAHRYCRVAPLAGAGGSEMKRSASHRPPPWVNRHLPRTLLRASWGRSASCAGPSY